MATYKTTSTHNSSKTQRVSKDLSRAKENIYTHLFCVCVCVCMCVYSALQLLICKEIILFKIKYYISKKQQLPGISEVL